MNPPAKWLIALGALLCAAAVAAGAFGAHALKARLSPDLLAVYRTAVEYHFYHARDNAADTTLAAASGWVMLAGIVLFSGSLYLLVATGTRWLGAVTPFGGLAFIVAWVLLAVAALRG